MKKFAILMLAALLVYACGNNDKTAQSLIKNELKQTQAGYEPQSFGSLDSLYTSYKNDSTFATLLRKADFYHTQYVEQIHNAIQSATSKQQEALQKVVKAYEDSATTYKMQLDLFKKSFRGVYSGWKMSHTYKLKHQGVDSVVTKVFYFDPRLTKITGNGNE
jgi:hypothetical protein